MSVVSYFVMSIDLEDKLVKVQRYCIFNGNFKLIIIYLEICNESK